MKLILRRFSKRYVLLPLLLAFALVPALVGQDMTVGENNEITFETPVKVGPTLLQPGTYQFEHIVKSHHHMFKLTPTLTSKGSHGVILQCKLEPVGAPAKYTVLHFAPGNQFKTLHYILVAGENSRHRF